MEINENTKLKDILAEHPELKERLTEINPKFKKNHDRNGDDRRYE